MCLRSCKHKAVVLCKHVDDRLAIRVVQSVHYSSIALYYICLLLRPSTDAVNPDCSIHGVLSASQNMLAFRWYAEQPFAAFS